MIAIVLFIMYRILLMQIVFWSPKLNGEKEENKILILKFTLESFQFFTSLTKTILQYSVLEAQNILSVKKIKRTKIIKNE